MSENFWLAIAAIALAALIVVFLFLNKVVREKGPGNRTIQIVLMCVAGPIILILGTQKILTAETVAALVGALIGFAIPRPGKQE